jgi:hypothetical protein
LDHFNNPHSSILHMQFRKHLLFLLLPLLILLCSWGGQGHYAISYRSSLFMPQSLLNTLDWADSLADHASDADDRKAWDPSESPKHYINIDDYPMFTAQGRIYQTYDSIIMCYGYSFVESKGFLPWATEAAYDSMKNNFIKHNWRKVVYYASDLGHYVGDGHMPLHLTRNYNGQYSSQDGVHSRIESDLIYDFLSQIIYTGDSVHMVNDANKYIFNYIYANYKYVDTLLAADLHAEQLAGNHYSTAYYNALWTRSKKSVTLMFHNASKALAELIYTAWTEAGSPTPVLSDFLSKESEPQWNIYPNPSQGNIAIHYNVDLPFSHLKISVFDPYGRMFTRIKNLSTDCGSHTANIDSNAFPAGIYLLEMEMNGSISTRKIVIEK